MILIIGIFPERYVAPGQGTPAPVPRPKTTDVIKHGEEPTLGDVGVGVTRHAHVNSAL